VFQTQTRLGRFRGGREDGRQGEQSKAADPTPDFSRSGAQPVKEWGNEAAYVKYANCMRANGYPTYPYPSGVELDGHSSTNFDGTGIDPNSPAFLNGNANQMCGKRIGAPAWWINNWGPPGSVDVYPAGTNPNSPYPWRG
jgi:hypothetical protein